MSHKFVSDSNFHLLLNKIDHEISEAARQKGCSYCGHSLHQADYPRSPAGLPAEFREHYNERHSLCCDTCRKRTTPPSVRFFGRRWFPAPLFVLISILTIGVNERRLSQVKRHFGISVSESTWKRWRRWWRELFLKTPFWQQAKGHVLIPIEETKSIPRALLSLFEGGLENKMRHLLKFLSPLSTSNLRAI